MIETFDIAGYCRISVDEELDPKRSFPAAVSRSLKTGTVPATPLSSARIISVCARGC